MLREAKIIVPKFTNAGQSLADVHASVASRLTAAFGGVTTIDGIGGWQHEDRTHIEPVRIFLVAVPEDEGARGNDDCDLCKIAHFARIAAEQEAIYVQFPDGEVQIIHRHPHEDRDAYLKEDWQKEDETLNK